MTKNKLPRINMAFNPDVYAYIKHMSRASGMTITEFVNRILKEHMEKHRDEYEQAISFVRGFDGKKKSRKRIAAEDLELAMELYKSFIKANMETGCTREEAVACATKSLFGFSGEGADK